MTTIHVKLHGAPSAALSNATDVYLLEEEHQVRLEENLIVAIGAFVFFWAVFAASWIISTKRVPEFSSFTPAQKADWCSRINSTIHAVAVVVGVVVALVCIEWGDDFMPMTSLRTASITFSIAIGYFTCDLIVIMVWPVPLQSVFVIHHTVAVVPYAINNFVACCAACQFGLLLFLLVELATLPLNARGFLESVGREDSKNHKRAIYATYIVWAFSRTVLPVFLVYSFWAYSYPSKRNHDVCLYPNLVGAHVIALFCVGVFFFVHTPEMLSIRRDRNLLPANNADVASTQVALPTPPMSVKEAKKLKHLASGSYEEVEPNGMSTPPVLAVGDSKRGGSDRPGGTMRLTVEVILRAQISINPLKDRELSLRGYQAPAIENLGVTKDGFDCIDLSDNEIKKLENFPRLRRLRMLLLNNNHIAKIQDNLADSIESLQYLILTGNRIADFSEVDRLVAFEKLDTLSLIGNPVTKRKYYRQYVIHKLPQLRVLDFQKIKPRERDAAAVFFNSVAGKRVEQEAEFESNGAVPPVTASVVPPPPPPAAAQPPPAAPKQVPPPAPAPPKPVPTPAPPAAKSQPADVEMAEPPSPVKKKKADPAPAPSTPPKPAKADVAMEEVPFTPSKPIEQLTVNQLREALKERGLATKGLKAELVKRLKEAVGSA
ncbi:hypothetical protein Poli38472_008495 [Pythium oligandrum]|uniref:SAP domain-containing protein n=1 Tax=Pythium oligandrum TaxID=41045 RepID=A0A8K1FDQ9_PYTOL|nr:hypothetical protein Poli38472_008495 [Pythium oligandrum]|eukprot:TMW55847.1 hypothetical protein Poli38472_008495 [Pythium oligandrum]